MTRPTYLSLSASLILFGAIAVATLAQDSIRDGPLPPQRVPYRRPLSNDPATLDPARIRDIYSLAVAQQIFDGLVQFDHKLTVTPALAQYWIASRDGLTWTFWLRKGVRFHHGREVTADDVVYSLTRLMDPKTKSGAADLFLAIQGAQEFRAGAATKISGLAVQGPHILQVTLKEAAPDFMATLAVGHAKVLPRELVEQSEDFGAQPVGTGPFQFVRWERGREIVLAANRDYFGGPPRLPGIVYRIFPGGQVDAMYQEFQRGALEESPVPVVDYQAIIARRNHVYVRRPMFSLRHYGFTMSSKPLDDRRVRQAILYAIDREAIVQEDFLGRYTIARGILPPGTAGFNARLTGYDHAPSKARELLREAGYPGGQGLPPIAFWSSAKHQGILREHERIGKNLADVGLRPEFHYLTDWPAFLKALEEKRFPVFMHAWFADVPDPGNFLFKLFYSRSSRNYMGYANPAVDALLLDARKETDPLQRVELYRRAEAFILNDAPVIPVWHYTYERLFQPYVKGVEVNGLGESYLALHKVWLEPPP